MSDLEEQFETVRLCLTNPARPPAPAYAALAALREELETLRLKLRETAEVGAENARLREALEQIARLVDRYRPSDTVPTSVLRIAHAALSEKGETPPERST